MLGPTSIHVPCTFARGSNRWTMAAQHTSRPRPGASFCLMDFLSGSTPPISSKRKQLPSNPRKKKFENAEKKKFEPKMNLFFWTFFLTSFLAVIERCTKSIFLFFSFPCPEGRFCCSSEPALVLVYVASPSVRCIVIIEKQSTQQHNTCDGGPSTSTYDQPTNKPLRVG